MKTARAQTCCPFHGTAQRGGSGMAWRADDLRARKTNELRKHVPRPCSLALFVVIVVTTLNLHPAGGSRSSARRQRRCPWSTMATMRDVVDICPLPNLIGLHPLPAQHEDLL